NFVSGGIALAFAYAVMHPLDTFKTRIQAATVTPGAASGGLGSIFARDTLRVLGSGFVASVSGAAPQGALRLATYELVKGYLMHLPPPSTRSHAAPDWLPTLSQVPASAISATIGDLASSVAKVPREVITTRLQAGTAANTNAALQQVLAEDGPRGLFRGFWSTTLRDVPFMVILFTTYENFKLAHQRGWRPFGASAHSSGVHEDGTPCTVPTLASTLFGGVSGAMAGYLTTPFDVIKTRVMTATRAGLSSTVAQTSAATKPPLTVMDAARAISREAGPWPAVGRAFFAGAVPRSVWWFCVCSIFFPVYERSKEVLADMTTMTKH
ncbi:mitochondrial carrier domain-containing protein, partial [Thamnocephalis sphaerospora]